ncbi:MAG TPA: dynamin family protein [Gallionella sp.]|nr:dynamin family protein [Gallionella sp.]HUW75094.1 dynamin family protein [Gallionella sp.]
MNDNHKRHLVAAFQHIDELLGEANHILVAADSASPFTEYTQDASPVQRKVIDDYIRRVRKVISRIMTDLNLPRPKPASGALWAAQTHVMFAQIAVNEMESKRMVGYGTLSDVDIKIIDDIVAELYAALEQFMSYLHQGSDADLPARLQKLEQTRDEMPLLRELERIITAHGLVALRGTLAMLLDRMESNSFEIGVFGRVSSGKSSLLNRLLGTAVLPVGVTPVTSVPTRIQFGDVPRASIEFAQAQPVVVELARLAEFSTEQQNQSNHKHVTRIVVEMPLTRLRESVSLVDTPGLGSLASSGAAETAAYLPRCDLGLVLIDAASALTHEDLILVQTLLRSGAKAMVLVSKADLLNKKERQHFLEYVQQQFAAQLGMMLPLYMVSVMGADAALCDEWFEQALHPLLEGHREQAAAALKRKVGLLREAVIQTLEVRLHGTSTGTALSSEKSIETALTALRNADGLCMTAERAADKLTDELPHLTDAMIEAAATATAALWQQKNTSPDFAAETRATTAQQMVADHSGKVLRLLEELRLQLEEVLRQGQQSLTVTDNNGDYLQQASGAPLFDAAPTIRQLNLQPPTLRQILPASLLLHFARSRLQVQWRAPLEDFLNDYSRRLRTWRRLAFDELRGSFHAHAAPLMAQLEARTTAAGRDNIHEAEDDLKRLREFGLSTKGQS